MSELYTQVAGEAKFFLNKDVKTNVIITMLHDIVVLLCSVFKPGCPAGNLYSLLQKLERKRDRGFRKAQQIVRTTPLQERHTNEYMP